MRYTIITPTVPRDTLSRLCESIDHQTCPDWQHLVTVDAPTLEGIPPGVFHPQRQFLCRWEPGARNVWERVATLRHEAWDHAAGDYLLYVDDDNYLADERVLESLLAITAPVALFPLDYRGAFASPLPIAVGRSDGNGLMVERSVGRWPLLGVRRDDGEFIVQLTTGHPYEVYDERALVVYEREGYGAK